MRSMREVLTRRFTHGLKEREENAESWEIYNISGFDPDGWRKRTGKCCIAGA